MKGATRDNAVSVPGLKSGILTRRPITWDNATNENTDCSIPDNAFEVLQGITQAARRDHITRWTFSTRTSACELKGRGALRSHAVPAVGFSCAIPNRSIDRISGVSWLILTFIT